MLKKWPQLVSPELGKGETDEKNIGSWGDTIHWQSTRRVFDGRGVQ